jgi:hypothetical protein
MRISGCVWKPDAFDLAAAKAAFDRWPGVGNGGFGASGARRNADG